MAEQDIYQMINERRAEMQPIFDRMDTDEKLYFLEPYTMKYLPPDDSKTADDVANVTLNDPLLYATKAIAIMNGMSMQTVVKGRKMSDRQTTKLEEFLADIYYAIDEWLLNRDIPGMDGFENEQICIRGRLAARCCFRLEGETFIPDVLPLDTRHFTPRVGTRGIRWAAPDYDRNKTEVNEEYPEATWAGASSEVVDYWDDKRNVVFINSRQARDQNNAYGYPPFVYVLCPSGSMLTSSEAVKHRGESIFWANRDLWPVMNQTASILQTVNVYSLFQSLQYESSHGENMPKPQMSPWKPRTIHGVEKGMGYKQMPMSDIKAAARLFYSALETRLQRGSIAAIDYGTLTFPLSSLAITRLTASRDDMMIPRFNGKAMFRQMLSRMITNQCLALDTEIHIGKPGSENTYTKADLDGDYTIGYEFHTESQEQAIANLSTASGARGILSNDTILRDVLKIKDPDGEKFKLQSEEAERMDEVLFLYRRASSLIEASLDKTEPEKTRLQREAYILGLRMQLILKQRKQLNTLSPIEHKEPEEAPQPNEKELLPLLSQGGRAPSEGEEIPNE